MTSGLPIIVFGYHDVGASCLDLLLERGEQVVAVFTHDDDPGEERWFRSVREIAEAAGIPVYMPTNPNEVQWVETVRILRPSLLFSFYYRRMLGPELLSAAALGAFNMHGSLLPSYRGRAPVNWAVLNGETRTGATLHVMTGRPDAGDIVDQQPVPIGPRDSARQVMDRITSAARVVLGRNLEVLKQGQAPRQPQDPSRASYFGGRRPEDGRISWSWPAPRIFNLVRAVTHPYPGAFTTVRGRRLFVWWAEPCTGAGRPGEVISLEPAVVAAGEGALELVRVQWEGESETAGVSIDRLSRGSALGD